jgi:diguanylate cyclase (GGDEF)-like protein/PAS domain S-box-containing protein
MNPRVVELVLKRCFGHREGETLCVVTDVPMAALGRAVADAAVRLGVETAWVGMAARTVDGEEPPPAVAAAFEAADLALLLTSRSLSHTEARRRASRSGTRMASMPGADGARLERLLDIDYAALQRDCRQAAGVLAGAKRIRLVTPAGTDLECEIDGRPPLLDAGLFLEPGAFGNLPAGEVAVAPLEGRTNGVVVVDGSLAGAGRVAEPFRVVIRDGRVVEAGHPALRAAIERYGPAAAVLAELGIGLNPRAQVVGNILEDEKARWTAHVAFGDNTGFGGTNRAPVHLDAVLLRPRLVVDGREVPAAELGWTEAPEPAETAPGPALLSVGPEDIETYRLLFEHSNDAQFVLDLDTQLFVEVNARFEQLTGYARPELLNPALRAPALIARESLPTYERRQQDRSAPPSERYDLRIQCRDGTKKPVELSVKRIVLRGRDVAIGAVRDLTERKKIEQELWQKIEDLGNANNRIFALTEKIKQVPRLMSQLLDVADEEEMLARAGRILADRQGLAFAHIEVYLVEGDVLALRHATPARAARRHRLDSAHRLVQVLQAGTPEISARGALLPLKGRDRTIGVLAVEFAPKAVDLLAGSEPVLKGFHDLLVTLANLLGLRVDNLRLYEAVRMQSIVDELTGVFNRRHFVAKLVDEVQRARRYGRDLSLMMIDLDNFKAVNDTHGHKQGDSVLAEVGKVLRGQTRGIDILCRYGGDEFALLLPETPRDKAAAKAEQLREAVRRHPFVNLADPAKPFALTLSLGVTSLRPEWTTDEAILHAADEALYTAKREGRDRVSVV